MKVCLINPPTTDPGERSLYFPMALLALGGVLREIGVDRDLWDFDLYFKSVGNRSERRFRRLLRHGVDSVDTHVFGISSICTNFPMALWIAREIRKHRPDAVIILGGPQPTTVPVEILERFAFVDLVVIGEAEQTLAELARRDFDPTRVEDVAGIASRRDGRARVSPARELVGNLDDLPVPDYSLIDLHRYIAYDPDGFTCQIEAGRGCPFKCTFCSTSPMWSRSYRVKSPARILAEMDALYRRYGHKKFDLIHDNFTTSRKFVRDFTAYMTAHNHEEFEWYCASRTDCLDRETLDGMQRAGLRSVFFGIETGSERMQMEIKKNLRFERFESLLERMDELRVGAVTAFILGFPEETLADMDETVWRALRYRSLGARRVFFAKIAALSGTELHRRQLPKLQLPQASDQLRPGSVSPQIYGLPWIHRVIEDHPDLFSSYYHIPHREMSCGDLWKFIEFAQLLVRGCPELALSVIEKTGWTATSLFRLWDRWAQREGFVYYDYDCHSFIFDRFRGVFVRFVDELERKGILGGRPPAAQRPPALAPGRRFAPIRAAGSLPDAESPAALR